MSNYLGRSPTTGSYEKLDSISSSFNGSNTAFNLTAGGIAVVPGTEQNLLISISGVIQEPGVAYTLTGTSQITFTGAPQSSDTFFGIMIGNTYDIGTPSASTVSASSMSSSFFVKNTHQNFLDLILKIFLLNYPAAIFIFKEISIFVLMIIFS